MKRTEFPDPLFLCSNSAYCTELGQLQVHEPAKLCYWTGRYRGYDGRYHSACKGGWFCQDCYLTMVANLLDPEQHVLNRNVSIDIHDVGPTLEEALKGKA